MPSDSCREDFEIERTAASRSHDRCGRHQVSLVISVDTKKKELIGNFRNGGSDYRPKSEPLRVKVHDFEDKTLGKIVPYGATGLTLRVHHYPPGTSKWNKIDRLAVVEPIGATTTKTGFKVERVLDERIYEKGIKVSDAEMRAIDITGDAFHPEWNYTIEPRKP